MFVLAGSVFYVLPFESKFGFWKSFLTNGNAFQNLLEVFSFVKKKKNVFVSTCEVILESRDLEEVKK